MPGNQSLVCPVVGVITLPWVLFVVVIAIWQSSFLIAETVNVCCQSLLYGLAREEPESIFPLTIYLLTTIFIKVVVSISNISCNDYLGSSFFIIIFVAASVTRVSLLYGASHSKRTLICNLVPLHQLFSISIIPTY